MDAKAAIEAIIEPWNRACIERDWDAALAMCHDNVVFMPPGAEAVAGSAVRAWLESFPVIKAMSWSIVQIDQDGDTAWIRGPVSQTLEVEGQEQQFNGKYCDVFRKGTDGKWRFSLIIWNSDEE